jgi:hypothetical protein
VAVTASQAMREIAEGVIKPSDCARTCLITLMRTVADKRYPAIPAAEISGMHNYWLAGRQRAESAKTK